MKLDLLYEVDSPEALGAARIRTASASASSARTARRSSRSSSADDSASTPSGSSSTTSARGARTARRPRCVIGALTQATESIRLGFGVTLLPYGFTHPARIAEKVATADVLSGGRVEWGTGRSTPMEQTAFHVDREATRDQWREAIEIICAHVARGALLVGSPDLPVPRARGHAEAGPGSAPAVLDGRDLGRLRRAVAGENALGLLSFSIMQPLERMAQQIEAYRKAQQPREAAHATSPPTRWRPTRSCTAPSRWPQAERNGIWESVAWWYQNLAQFTIDWELVAPLARGAEPGLPAAEAADGGEHPHRALPRRAT